MREMRKSSSRWMKFGRNLGKLRMRKAKHTCHRFVFGGINLYNPQSSYVLWQLIVLQIPVPKRHAGLCSLHLN